MEDLDGFAIKIIDDLTALPEDRMRLGLIGRRLKGLCPEDAARVMEILYRDGPGQKTSINIRSLLMDPNGLKALLGEERYRSIYTASVRLGLKRVGRLFTELPPHKKGLHGYDTEEDARMEFITLGERRAMSKSPVKETVDRLLSDPDPVVVSNLLNNPRITVKEVLKIASKRPSSEKIIRLLIGHRVWSKRYEVKKAVASNPYTPPRLAIGVLELLLIQDLKELAEDKTIHPQVRMSARDLLDERTGKGAKRS